jgi:hypothetical protein
VRYDGPGFPLVWGDRASTQEEIGEDMPGYEIILEGAFSVVNIEECPPPEGGWPAPRMSPEPPETREESAEPAPAETGSGPPPEDPDGA